MLSSRGSVVGPSIGVARTTNRCGLPRCPGSSHDSRHASHDSARARRRDGAVCSSGLRKRAGRIRLRREGRRQLVGGDLVICGSGDIGERARQQASTSETRTQSAHTAPARRPLGSCVPFSHALPAAAIARGSGDDAAAAEAGRRVCEQHVPTRRGDTRSPRPCRRISRPAAARCTEHAARTAREAPAGAQSRRHVAGAVSARGRRGRLLCTCCCWGCSAPRRCDAGETARNRPLGARGGAAVALGLAPEAPAP